jgi:ABC-type amino acid transport substrate-binding protein
MTRAATLLFALLVTPGFVHAQGQEGRLKKIADTGTVTIAYRADATPFSFKDDKERITGFSTDLCKRVVDLIERQLNAPKLQVRWQPVTVQTRFDAVAKGQADMECGSSTVTLSRMKLVDFSSYIFIESTGLLIKAASGLRSLSDMSGRRIAVVSGTTNERAVRAQLSRRQISATVLPFATRDEAFAALQDGNADAFASDKLLLVGVGNQARDSKSLRLLPDELSFEP